MSNRPFDAECDSYYLSLKARVEVWLASDEARSIPRAELYRHLPELYLLLLRLALDPAVPQRERTAVLATIKYIVAPYDLIPEAIHGVAGLRDDLVLAAFMVERLCSDCDEASLARHWQGPVPARRIAHEILDAGGALVGDDLLERLRGWLPA